MTHSAITRTTLAVAGLVGAGVGGAILAVPEAFYAGYGITLGQNASLMSELRGIGGALVGIGVLVLAGAVIARRATASLRLAATVYLGFGLARVASMALDGLPDSGLVAVAVLELAIGAGCLALFLRDRARA